MKLKNYFFLLLFIVCFQHLSARLHDNAYRNVENKFYWQNRLPDASYWQQDVEYKIMAVLAEDSNLIEGLETLNYWNNSPDTLNEAFFHLYQNAFIKGSHLHNLELANKVKSRLGMKEAAGLGIVINEISVNGQSVKTQLDNTIMKVYLPAPLYPGGKITFKVSFRTYYDNGGTRRRMQMYDAWGFKHYNGAQWFPKICVYDRVHGWDTYQHLNREFYGDYGLYNVVLNCPSNYILEATGELQNRNVVLPDTLRRKLDIKNFAHKKWNEPPSTIIPYVKGERKDWHFIANNVHDFAFVADPSFRIGTAFWNDVECVAVVQEPHAAGWQNAADYVSKIIKTFSEEIGTYCYPKIVAADAQDGMEYPMLTMDGGFDPNYRGLFVHEIGHNWFYGQVGNNETYRAALDEGFTQFLTALGVRKIEGEFGVATPPKSWYRKMFSEPAIVLDRTVLNSYTYDALNRSETSINTHSDDFNSSLNHGGGYRQVYFKTASMLYNLEYVLGDSLFKAALHHYFEQWKFAHPYVEDFRSSVIQFTHCDLAWFFDQWFETTKPLDYGIGRIKKIKRTDSFTINFWRKGEMQMPIDFTVTANDGKLYSYYIPNTWFQKESDAVKLPIWFGWGKLYKNYKAHVEIPGGLASVQIDTTFRLADRNYLDNFKAFRGSNAGSNVVVKLDGGLTPQPDRRNYRLDVRPDFWWNSIDGLKAGVHFEGDYFFTLHKIDATIWWNSHFLTDKIYNSAEGLFLYKNYSPINYTFNYITPLNINNPKLLFQLNSRNLDGLWLHKIGFSWYANDNNLVQISGQNFYRDYSQDLNYLLFPQEWSSYNGFQNRTVNLTYIKNYGYLAGSGKLMCNLRMPLLTKDFDYSYAQVEAINYSALGKLDIHTRLFARYGTGNKFPSESLLFLAGANPEEEMENKYTRSVGFVPESWQGMSNYDVNHFQQGGGLNLRGYTGYFAPDDNANQKGLMIGYKGTGGISANIEIGFEKLTPVQPKIVQKRLHVNLYAFADAGYMLDCYSESFPVFVKAPYMQLSDVNQWSTLHADAGLGAAFTIKNWGVFEKAKPLTIRVDLPFFLNRPPYSNTQYLALRYVLGINRAF